MDRVFIYWDNSNIFHEMQRLAGEREEGPDARYRVRISFDAMLHLAHAGRPMERAVAAGSVPPEMRQLCNRMENSGVEVRLFDRGNPERVSKRCRTGCCNSGCWKTLWTTTETLE